MASEEGCRGGSLDADLHHLVLRLKQGPLHKPELLGKGLAVSGEDFCASYIKGKAL